MGSRAIDNISTTTAAPPRHRPRPATCGHRRPPETTPTRDSTSTSTGRHGGSEEWTRDTLLDVNGLRVTASTDYREGRARPCSAGMIPSTRNSSNTAAERCESAWEGSPFATAEQRLLEANCDGWMETWIYSALQARQRVTNDKAPPSNEPDDDNDDNGEWANTDIDACDPFTEEVHHTESPYRPAACSPHHQCCWGTDEPRARRRSFRRPQTAAAYTGYSAPSLRGGIADCTHQRPKSAGGVGMGRRGMPHWPGARLTTRPGLAARLPSRRPSLCQVNGIGACKRGARRGVRAGGAGGSSQKVSRGCCRPQVEATWSYRPSKRPGKRDSPRQILVKVPCVKSNGKGRRGRVSYTLAWNSDAREDGCDGEIHDTSDNGDKKALEVVNDESEGVVADSVYGGTSFRQNTTAVGQVSRPLPLKASSTATGAGSIPPQANVEGTPRRTSVTTQLRSSVEHQRRPTSSSKAGDAAKMTANLPNFSCESQGKPCDRPPNVSTADNRGGRTSTIRSHSATTDTRTSSRDPRSHREGVGTQGGGVGTYVLTGDIISAPKRESSWAGPTEASVNAYALRPKTADKTRKVRREGAVSVEYSFFPSPKVEGHGEGCIFTKRNHSIPPFGAGEVNGSVSEWERSMCSTTDDARSGFGFDVGSPGTLRGTLRETVDC